MAYVLDGDIEAVDFNTFRLDLLDIYNVGFGDSGYGQIVNGEPGISGPVAVNDVVQSVEWDEFLDAAEICRSHQGSTTTFPPNSEVAAGEIVEAHESDAPTSNPFDIDGSLLTLNANRLIAAGGSTTLSLIDQSSNRAVSWANQLVHQFEVQFSTIDDARYFFNSGGEIRFRGERSGGAGSAQNAAWTALLDTATPATTWNPIFNHTETTAPTGGTGSSIGYYNLTGGFQTLATLADTGTYGANNILLEGRTVDGTGGANGDNGRRVEFRITFTDGHTNIFDDVVDGSFNSFIDTLRATAPLNILVPVYPVNSIELTAGT